MVKILTLIVSGEEEKIRTALTFSKRQSEAGHEIRVLLFGPSEKTVASNEKLESEFRSMGAIRPKACVFVAKNAGVDDKLSQSFELLPAGQYITKSIEEGYSTVSF
jgi:hypothetical protein